MKPTLFNHTLEGAYPADELSGIVGVERYSCRVLASSMPGDTVQLDASLAGEYPWIADHYARAGIPHASDIVWNIDWETLRAYPDHELSVFLFTRQANEFRPDQPWFDITEEMNDKNAFIRLCESVGVPTPQTLCFSAVEELQSHRGSLKFPAYLKVTVSASGQGVMRVENREELERLLAERRPEAFQLQEEVANARFLNLQYRIKNGVAQRMLASAQVLKGVVHDGNEFPSPVEPWSITDPLAQEMARRGMKGIFAFDVAVTGPDESQWYLIECNPRWNGATYFTNVAFKLGATQWSSCNVSTGKRKTLAGLSLGDLEYDPERRTGVVIVNWGCILEGKLGILLVGDAEQRAKLLEALPSCF